MQNQEDKTKIRCSLVLLRSDVLLLGQADTASAITVSSPIPAAPPTSLGYASFSARCRHLQRQARNRTWAPFQGVAA